MIPGDKLSVLLVDDLPENLYVLKATLKPLDVDLVEARSGREALDHLAKQDFAVVLLDVMMPEMDGFETARHMRERERSKLTPIIFVTAMYLSDADAFRGYSVGAVDYIMKPYSPDILRSKVSVFVDLFRKSEELKRQAEHIRLMEQREYFAKLTAAEERMRQEANRERYEARAIRTVLEYAPVGFARLDGAQRVIESNRVFAEQFSLSSDINGMPLLEALPELPPPIMEAITHCRPILFHDHKAYEGVGTETSRFCDLAVWPIEDKDGQLTNSILVVTDVTQRALKDLQRTDFVATLAHDLQTPVIASDRALLLLLNQLGDNNVSSDLISLVTMLKKNNLNLLHMIQALMDVYHYEDGATALNFDEVDLRLLIDSCIEEILPLAQEQGLTIDSNLAEALTPLYADRTAIRRVITNLLDNSIKFTPRGGSISVQVKKRENNIIVEVTDTGIGIKDSDRQHLFERYWHGPGIKSYKRNCGLGLYLCRQIVESHHGQIECESIPGEKTTFRFVLPVRDKEILTDRNKRIKETAI